MVRIWEGYVRTYEEDRKKRKQAKSPPCFPPIIPVVIYHGESEWKIATEFTALFDVNPVLRPFVPGFSYHLCDISHHSDEEIRGEVMLRVGLLIMKYIFRQELPERLPGILALLRELLGRRSWLEYLETVATYLVRGADKLTEKEMGRAMASALSSAGGDLMPTIAERWLEQGRTEGERTGEMRGLLSGIETGLEIRFGSRGLRILPEIRRIQDVRVLMAVQKGLWTSDSPDELRRIYN